jgi:hypothetical protein
MLKTRNFLADLHANVWHVDQPLPGHLQREGSFDLKCDFSKTTDLGVRGMLWLELKVFAANGCQAKIKEAEKALTTKFPQVCALDSSIGGAMLLVARVDKATSTTWGHPKLLARVLTAGSTTGFTDLT